MIKSNYLIAINDFLFRFMFWGVYAWALTSYITSHPGQLEPYGIALKDFQLEGLSVFLLSLLIITLTSPRVISSARDFFSYTMILLIIVPSSILILFASDPNMKPLFFIVFVSIICFTMLFFCRAKIPQKFDNAIISSSYASYLAYALVFLLAFQVYFYWDVIDITNLNDIYIRRFLNAPKNLLTGHISLLSGFVMPCILLVIALKDRTATHALIALIGFFSAFLVGGHKAALVYPILITVLYFGLSLNIRIITSPISQLIFISLILFYLSSYWLSTDPTYGFIIRVLLIPAIAIEQCYLVMNELGYTFFSQIKYLNIDSPVYEAKAYWPNLDLTLGEILGFGNKTGFNTNLYASGLISWGLLGVAVNNFIAMSYFWLFDYLTQKLPKVFSITLAFPFILILVNIPIHTFLSSFGGLFLIVFIYFAVQRRNVKPNA